MESARTHHAFHIQFSPPQDMAVRVSIGSMRQGWGWRPMSWTVAGLEGRRGRNDNADGSREGVPVLVRLEGGRLGQKIQGEWTGDLG